MQRDDLGAQGLGLVEGEVDRLGRRLGSVDADDHGRPFVGVRPQVVRNHDDRARSVRGHLDRDRPDQESAPAAEATRTEDDEAGVFSLVEQGRYGGSADEAGFDLQSGVLQTDGFGHRGQTFALQMAQPPWPQLQRGPDIPRSSGAPRFRPKTPYCFSTFFEPHFAQAIFCLSVRTSTSKRVEHLPQTYS